MAENRDQYWEFETDVPPADETYSLEDILAEYGGQDRNDGGASGGGASGLSAASAGENGSDTGDAPAPHPVKPGQGRTRASGQEGGKGSAPGFRGMNWFSQALSGVRTALARKGSKGEADSGENAEEPDTAVFDGTPGGQAVPSSDAAPKKTAAASGAAQPTAASGTAKPAAASGTAQSAAASGTSKPAAASSTPQPTAASGTSKPAAAASTPQPTAASGTTKPAAASTPQSAAASGTTKAAAVSDTSEPAAASDSVESKEDSAKNRDPMQAVEEIRSAIETEAAGKEPERKRGFFRPRSANISDLIGRTVDAAITERKEKAGRKRQALFSRQTLWDTRDLNDGLEGAEKPGDIVPEPPLGGAAAEFRAEYERRVRTLIPAAGTALLPLLLLLLEWYGLAIPVWSTSSAGRSILLMLCLGLTAWLCRKVFTGSAGVFLCGAAAMVSLCDCAVRIFSETRTPVDSYGAISCLVLAVAQWGMSLESRAMYDTFRAAAVDSEPPYLLTDTEEGACKQRGSVPGFYTTAMGGNISSMWLTLLLPLLLVASMVFATLSSVGQDRSADFFLNWSAILTAGATLCLPLCWGLPWAHLARKLHGAGCAVAGWNGAEHISRRKTMILTDGDLFPPGSIALNGVKLYGNEMAKAVSCAASMTRAAACGLERVFDDLLRSEMGAHLPVDDFSFYEEGGYSGVVQGQNVLLGTRSFLRRMGIPLPRDLRVTTGMYLAVDRHLMAVFSMRYQASENVDFALHMLRRNHITPVLASRDPNITPALLRRKFRRTIKMEYPPLAERVALSEVEFDQDIPRALLFREGLLPYAEAVVGSHRLCRAVRRATMLGLFGSMSGMLLTFYLVFRGKYDLLSPLTLLLFLLLWLVPSLLLMDLV